MLDFRMETFLIACKTMNFTKAAERLHITQPAVSHHIRALEEAYGVRLFDYAGKKLRLTPAGAALLEAATTMQNDVRLLKRRLCRLSAGQSVLNFGATLTIGEYVMPAALSSFLQAYPETTVHMTVADTRELLRKINDGKIDFALVEGFYPKSEFDSLRFSKERFVAVRGRDYVFSKPVRRVEDLLDERLLIREEGSGTRRIVGAYLDGRNLRIQDFHRLAEISNIAAIKTLTAAGYGVTFLYEAAVKAELAAGTLCEIPLEDFAVEHDFSFIWRKDSLFADRYREIFHLLHDHMPAESL